MYLFINISVCLRVYLFSFKQDDELTIERAFARYVYTVIKCIHASEANIGMEVANEVFAATGHESVNNRPEESLPLVTLDLTSGTTEGKVK